MPVQLQFAALVGFAALMALAALEDLRRLVIPNVLTLSLCALWPFYVLAAPSLFGVLGALACGLAVFFAGALLFSRGYLGGGDVKLLAVATLWAGPPNVPALLLLTAILGGLLALALLMPPAAWIAELARAKLGPTDASTKTGMATPVPYGIAIAAASLIVVFIPHLP